MVISVDRLYVFVSIQALQIIIIECYTQIHLREHTHLNDGEQEKDCTHTHQLNVILSPSHSPNKLCNFSLYCQNGTVKYCLRRAEERENFKSNSTVNVRERKSGRAREITTTPTTQTNGIECVSVCVVQQ